MAEAPDFPLAAYLELLVLEHAARRAREALGSRREESAGRTNLSWSFPAPLDELCYRAFAAELPLLRSLDLPFGHSLVAIARRPAKSSAARLIAEEDA